MWSFEAISRKLSFWFPTETPFVFGAKRFAGSLAGYETPRGPDMGAYSLIFHAGRACPMACRFSY